MPKLLIKNGRVMDPASGFDAVSRYLLEQAARYAAVNILPIGAITENSEGEKLAAIGSMKAADAVAISDDGRLVMNSRVMRRAMEFAREDRSKRLRCGVGAGCSPGRERGRFRLSPGLRG